MLPIVTDEVASFIYVYRVTEPCKKAEPTEMPFMDSGGPKKLCIT